MPPREDTTLRLSDGRNLAYTEWGPVTGRPVLYCHGTPGSRIWCPDESATVAADVRLIIPDRPSVGRSDPKDGANISDWVADTVELAGALSLKTFAVVGVSAGGPFAAACAALIPSRLTGVGMVSSRAPAQYNWEERPGIDQEWPDDEQAEFELIQRDPVAGADLAAANFEPFVSEFEQHPEGLHDDLGQAEGDRWIFADPDLTAMFDAHIRESWRQGLDVYAWELTKVYRPWGFRLADISIPVHVWHGSQDPWVRQDQIDWQVSRIPHASLVVWDDCGHMGFAKHWGEILETVTAIHGALHP